MSKTQVYVLHLGVLNIPRNENIAPETPEIAAENRRLNIPIYCVLIKHKTLGNILFDTGCALDWRQTYNPAFKDTYFFEEEYTLPERLREVGLTVEDIDQLILSHLHFDHTGNLKLFAGTKAGQAVMISEPEARNAFYEADIVESGYNGAYIRSEICGVKGIQYRVMPPGDIELADDLVLFAQKGHTPCVYGMLVKTEGSGNFVFTSDGIHNLVNWGPPIKLPGLCMYPEDYLENIRKVRQLVEESNAQFMLGHDMSNYNTFKRSPEFYE